MDLLFDYLYKMRRSLVFNLQMVVEVTKKLKGLMSSR